MSSKRKKYKETKNRKKLKKRRLQTRQIPETPSVKRDWRQWAADRLRWLRDRLGTLKLTDGAAWRHALLPVIMPAAVLLIAQIITDQSASALLWPFAHGGAFLLGWFVLLGVCLLAYGVIGRAWPAWLLTAAPCMLVALVSHYKEEIHGAPLMMNDFTLIGEFALIAGYAMPNLKITLPIVAALLLAVGSVAALIALDRKSRPERPVRCVFAGAGLLVVAISLFVLPGSAVIKQAEQGAATHTERVETSGVLVGLYCTWAADRSMEQEIDLSVLQDSMQDIHSAVPEDGAGGEQTADADTTEPAPEPEEPTETPTVIFLMAESFFDITEIPTLTFETDPIPVFHAVEETATSGKLISNTYVGGTGYVEMEVLTGICSYLLKESDTLTSLPFEVYDAMPCISDVFDRYGYRMEFIHSHTNALYNRETIYRAFGFDSVRFSDSFPADAERSGGYVSDMALSEELIAAYENRGEEPLMLFSVSMENHQPYYAAKYPDASGVGTASDVLTAEELAVVDSYVHGLVNADRALGRLIDYFSAVEEPVMLVFWGDHLPNLKLPDGTTAFEKLGWCTTGLTTAWEPEELKHMLSTDYFIWTNYETEQADRVSSSTLLGLQALNALGFELTDYYLWLEKNVVPEYLMYRPRLFADSEGGTAAAIPEQAESTMKIYRAAVYNMVYGEQDLFTAYRVDQAEAP